MAKDKLENKIGELLLAIEKIASNQVAPITPIAPIASVSSEDHDLLITLVTKVDGVKEDIRVLNDGTNAKINDHETRIRSLEKTQETQSSGITLTNKIVMGACAIVLVSVMSGLVYLVVK